MKNRPPTARFAEGVVCPALPTSTICPPAVTRPFASVVTTEYVPGVPTFFNAAEMDTFAEPSKFAEPVTSFAKEIARGVASFAAVAAFVAFVADDAVSALAA